MTRLEIHAALAGFPEQPEPELSRLALDVKKNGLVNPIVLCDGKVLDGRARLTACERAEVAPRFFDYLGDDPVAFVVAANAGRQMTPGQRALAAARAARAWKEVPAGTPEVPAGTRQDASERAATAFGVSRRTVFRAERLLGDEALVRAVESGRMKVSAALSRVAPESKPKAEPRDPDGRVAVAAAVDRVEKRALALRDDLRDLCGRPYARGMLGDLLQELATEFFNLAEGESEKAAQ